MRGISRSQIIRSGAMLAIFSSASTPSSARDVVAPSEDNHESSSDRKTGSSSTIKICFPANGCVMVPPLADSYSIVACYWYYRLSDFAEVIKKVLNVLYAQKATVHLFSFRRLTSPLLWRPQPGGNQG